MNLCHVTVKVTPENAWAGAQLRAKREKAGLTQLQVAELAGIDRSRYVALETGRQTITLTYARRVAAAVGVEDPRELLPPTAGQQAGRSPLDRLRELEVEVARLKTEHAASLQAIVVRLAAAEAVLEHAGLLSAQPPSARRRDQG